VTDQGDPPRIDEPEIAGGVDRNEYPLRYPRGRAAFARREREANDEDGVARSRDHGWIVLQPGSSGKERRRRGTGGRPRIDLDHDGQTGVGGCAGRKEKPACQRFARRTRVRHGHDAPPVDVGPSLIERDKSFNPLRRSKANLAFALFRLAGDKEVSVRTGREDNLVGLHRRETGWRPVEA